MDTYSGVASRSTQKGLLRLVEAVIEATIMKPPRRQVKRSTRGRIGSLDYSPLDDQEFVTGFLAACRPCRHRMTSRPGSAGSASTMIADGDSRLRGISCRCL